MTKLSNEKCRSNLQPMKKIYNCTSIMAIKHELSDLLIIGDLINFAFLKITLFCVQVLLCSPV